jgi:hypothetical protein
MMLWIKRNLFLAVSGLAAAILIALGGFYLFSSWRKNSTVEGDLESSLATLTNLYNADPFPHPTNVTLVRDYVKLLKSKNAALQPLFTPAPAARVSGLQFRSVLDKTLADLHRMAAQANIELPRTNYAFSFDAIRHKASFAPESFPLMPQQLADIQAICAILFEARVRPLINVRRARVSTDDTQATSDYHSLLIETNPLTGALVSPYEFEFQCMSEGLATVLQKLAESPEGFIVRSVRTEPIDEKNDAPPGMAGPAGIDALAPPAADPAFDRGRFNQPGRSPRRSPPGVTPPPPRGGPRGGPGGPPPPDRLLTPLKEKRLTVTLHVAAIRPAGKS